MESVVLQDKSNMYLSASAINTFFSCPKKFYYNYIMGIKSSPNIHTIRGNVCHHALESFYNATKEQINSLNLEELKLFFTKRLIFLFDKKWSASKFRLMNLDLSTDKLNYFYNESLQMLFYWLNFFMISFENNFKIDNYTTFLRLTPRRELYIKSEKFKIQGFIDVVEEIEGNVKISDYKTSSKSNITEDYKLQLSFYVLLYYEKFNKLPDFTSVFFLRDREVYVRITSKDLKDTIFKIMFVRKVLKEINSNNFPKKITPLCKWHNSNGSGQCDYYDHCF